MKTLNVALIGYKFMGKAHSSALLECPFFFKNGVQPVRKVIVGRHEAPLKQALDTGIRSSRMGEIFRLVDDRGHAIFVSDGGFRRMGPQVGIQ